MANPHKTGAIEGYWFMTEMRGVAFDVVRRLLSTNAIFTM